MSAFVVSHDHIDALLTFATDQKPNDEIVFVVGDVGREITAANATEIGRILLAENVRSVQARYPQLPASELPGALVDEDTVASYKFGTWRVAKLEPLWILKACDSFDHQACETEDYEASDACVIIEAIRIRAIRELPGYTNAPGWSLDRERFPMTK
jgi:hypothetical protein